MRTSLWTPAFDAYVGPARARPQIWRLALGIVAVLALWLLGVILAMAALAVVEGPATLDATEIGRTPASLIALLLSFVGLALGSWVAAQLMHGRTIGQLLGPRVPGRFLLGAGVTFGVAIGASLLLGLLGPAPPLERNVDPDTFTRFLLPALVALLIQTGAEELAFRGYLQGQLAARFRHPIVWMGLPAIVFGLAHADPAAGPNMPLIVGVTTLVGLITADLTRVTGGLGAAWGLHFANNVMAVLAVSLADSLSGLSWWRLPYATDDVEVVRPLILQDALVLVIIWAVLRLILARRAE